LFPDLPAGRRGGSTDDTEGLALVRDCGGAWQAGGGAGICKNRYSSALTALREPDPLTAENFRIASCQATIFTPDEEVSAVKLLAGPVQQWLRRFDADPTILPLAEGMPREIPRLILNSTSESWRCEIASARMNVFWRRTKTVSPALTPGLTEFFTEATTLLSEYSDFVKARVGRMAAVLTRFAPHPEPGLFLSRHFCNERWFHAR
jgi:hypothetical protein